MKYMRAKPAISLHHLLFTLLGFLNWIAVCKWFYSFFWSICWGDEQPKTQLSTFFFRFTRPLCPNNKGENCQCWPCTYFFHGNFYNCVSSPFWMLREMDQLLFSKNNLPLFKCMVRIVQSCTCSSELELLNNNV